LGLGNTNRGRYSNPLVDQLTEQAIVTIDDNKREKLLQEATAIAIGDLGIIPIHYEVSTWGMLKSLSYKARTDQYTLAMDIRLR
jgi:peptide/nickel transport system substrate-binding protein